MMRPHWLVSEGTVHHEAQEDVSLAPRVALCGVVTPTAGVPTAAASVAPTLRAGNQVTHALLLRARTRLYCCIISPGPRWQKQPGSKPTELTHLLRQGPQTAPL